MSINPTNRVVVANHNVGFSFFTFSHLLLLTLLGELDFIQPPKVFLNANDAICNNGSTACARRHPDTREEVVSREP